MISKCVLGCPAASDGHVSRSEQLQAHHVRTVSAPRNRVNSRLAEPLSLSYALCPRGRWPLPPEWTDSQLEARSFPPSLPDWGTAGIRRPSDRLPPAGSSLQ